MNLNNFLPQIAFILLLLLMLLYWVQAAFFGKEKYRSLNNFISFLSLTSLTLLLTFRWIESKHFPLSNLYESLVFLSWCFLTLKIVSAFDTKIFVNLDSNESAALTPPSQIQRKAEQDISLGLGIVLSPLALLTFGFAFLSLPKEMQRVTTLVPALQSNWLMMHVTVMVLSYAALLSGSVLSIVFLILSSLEDAKGSYFTNPFTRFLTKQKLASSNSVSAAVPNQISASFYPIQRVMRTKDVLRTCKKMALTKPVALQGKGFAIQMNTQENETIQVSSALSLTDKLDNYSYRVLALGFPLLTIGILSGAVWANEAWGSYWSWDPKETWALITWLVFAIYLHTRITKGWSGQKSAVVASAGFFVVWFCYLGVNLLGTGLHSYGWFSK